MFLSALYTLNLEFESCLFDRDVVTTANANEIEEQLINLIAYAIVFEGKEKKRKKLFSMRINEICSETLGNSLSGCITYSSIIYYIDVLFLKTATVYHNSTVLVKQLRSPNFHSLVSWTWAEMFHPHWVTWIFNQTNWIYKDWRSAIFTFWKSSGDRFWNFVLKSRLMKKYIFSRNVCSLKKHYFE